MTTAGKRKHLNYFFFSRSCFLSPLCFASQLCLQALRTDEPNMHLTKYSHPLRRLWCVTVLCQLTSSKPVTQS